MKPLYDRTFFVSYGQMCVAPKLSKHVFQRLFPAHFDQGFGTWDDSVTFLTPYHSEEVRLTITEGPSATVAREAERAIQVPFQCDAAGKLKILSVGSSIEVTLRKACHSVLFQMWEHFDQTQVVTLNFVAKRIASPVIHVNDGTLIETDDFLLGGEPP